MPYVDVYVVACLIEVDFQYPTTKYRIDHHSIIRLIVYLESYYVSTLKILMHLYVLHKK